MSHSSIYGRLKAKSILSICPRIYTKIRRANSTSISSYFLLFHLLLHVLIYQHGLEVSPDISAFDCFACSATFFDYVLSTSRIIPEGKNVSNPCFYLCCLEQWLKLVRCLINRFLYFLPEMSVRTLPTSFCFVLDGLLKGGSMKAGIFCFSLLSAYS